MQKLIDEFQALRYPAAEIYGAILPSFIILSYQRPELLLVPGQVLRRLYFVRSGYIRVYRKQKGQEATLRIVGAGNWLSLPASFYRQVEADMYIEACRKSEVYCMDYGDYARLFRQDAQFAEAAQQILVKLHGAAEARERLVTLSRPVSLRLDQVFADAPDVLEYVNQKDLASYACVSTSSVSRYRARNRK